MEIHSFFITTSKNPRSIDAIVSIQIRFVSFQSARVYIRLKQRIEIIVKNSAHLRHDYESNY